jgi:hypothetical protein
MSPTLSGPRTRTRRRAIVETLVQEPVPVSAAVSLRWLWYALSIFIPYSGIFIALFLYDQDSREVRQVGRNCLLIGFLIWVLLPALALLAFAMVLVLGLLSLAADMMPPTD